MLGIEGFEIETSESVRDRCSEIPGSSANRFARRSIIGRPRRPSAPVNWDRADRRSPIYHADSLVRRCQLVAADRRLRAISGRR
jgi:hypothetical protein